MVVAVAGAGVDDDESVGMSTADDEAVAAAGAEVGAGEPVLLEGSWRESSSSSLEMSFASTAAGCCAFEEKEGSREASSRSLIFAYAFLILALWMSSIFFFSTVRGEVSE